MERECDHCGEPAKFKLTFLLNGARGNPKSSAYGRDDCSWCEDECGWACAEHKEGVRTDPDYALDGMSWCATFERARNFEHLFLYKKKIEESK